jgi:hypothetical protein
MGYACPVCDEPQQDAEHLANHLAFQAMTHGDDHESWLDEHTPGWEASGPAELAPRLTELADDAPYEVVFEDTTPASEPGERHDPGIQGATGEHSHGSGRGHDHSRPRGDDSIDETADLAPEERAVVEAAQELTREMLGGDGEDGDGARKDDSE